MNMFRKNKLIKALLNSIKPIENDFSKDYNVFFEILGNLTDKEILELNKNKKIKKELSGFFFGQEQLSEKNKITLEKIEKLLVDNGEKEISNCLLKNKEIWKTYLLKNQKHLIYYTGELDEELKSALKNLLTQNPNLIYEYTPNNQQIISFAFKTDGIELRIPDINEQGTISFSQNLVSNSFFLENPDVNIKVFKEYKDDLNNPKLEPFKQRLKDKIRNIEFVDSILKELEEKTIRDIFSIEDYQKFADNYNALSIVKSSAFKKLGNIYGPIKIKNNNENNFEVYAELYNYNKEFLSINLNDFQLDYYIKQFLEGDSVSKIFNSMIINNSKYKKDFIEFLKLTNYTFTKEDIFRCPKLYDYIDNKILFTLDDFTQKKFSGISNRLIIECLDYIEPKFIDLMNGEISDEVVNKAIEKNFEFKEKHYGSFQHNEKIYNYLIENQDFDVLYSYWGYIIQDEKNIEKAFDCGFIPDFDKLKNNYNNHPMLHNDKIIKKMIDNNYIDAIFQYNGDNIEVYKYALEQDLKDKKIDYKKEELEFLKLLIKCEGLELFKSIRNKALKNEINIYFDKDGPNKEFINEYFSKYGYQGWEIIEKINVEQRQKYLDEKQLVALKYLKTIQHDSLKKIYVDFINNNIEIIDVDKIKLVADVLKRISNSNSNEIIHMRDPLALEVLKVDNPLEKLEEVEQIFIKNNLPTVGKHYKVFKTLHDNYSIFDEKNSGTISPMLKHSSDKHRDIIIFADLIKASFGSNNKSVRRYLENIKKGSDIFRKIINNNNYTKEDNEELLVFRNHLTTLYNNSLLAKRLNSEFDISDNLVEDITKLLYLISPNKTLDYNYEDRITNMFCHFAGFKTYEDAINYFEQKTKLAEEKNKKYATKPFKLERGDLVKGIGNIEYLSTILQNGSVAKEFLGSSAGSDATPLDTDCSMILGDFKNNEEALSSTEANKYGPIYFVLKNSNDRFNITRDRKEELKETKKSNKLELFYTGVLDDGHYGIRTGFASSEIDYIIINEIDKRVFLDIAKNGFYIPVVSSNGDLLFSFEDYEKLREKMQGLSAYEMEKYNISKNLLSDDINITAELIEEGIKQTIEKRNAIEKHIERVLNSLGLKLKTKVDGDLTEGYAELIDTGSTSRYTNKIGDGDFDFMLRLDNIIYNNPEQLEIIKETFRESFIDVKKRKPHHKGDIRYEGVTIEGLDYLVDIDISFTKKTTGLTYSTDMCLNDRLNNIKKQYPEKYKYVIANILKAKEVFKEAECYKSGHAETPQGGLGGVGIENWILQYGGSFNDAALDFLKNAEGKDFKEFKKTYEVWDFGENHKAIEKGYYLHDNFVRNNMTEEGYKKMVAALKQYLYSNNYDIEFEEGFTK